MRSIIARARCLSCALAVFAVLVVLQPGTAAAVVIHYTTQNSNTAEWFADIPDARVVMTTLPSGIGLFSFDGMNFLHTGPTSIDLEYNAPQTQAAVALAVVTGPRPAVSPAAETQPLTFDFVIDSPDVVGSASRTVTYDVTFTHYNYTGDYYLQGPLPTPEPITFQLTGGRTLIVAFQGTTRPGGLGPDGGGSGSLLATFTLVPEPASATVMLALTLAAASMRRRD